VQANAVREQIVDRSRVGSSAQASWKPVVRIQVAM
jgi:hypothetical protein